MALSVNQFVSEGDILMITSLKQGKVYKLWGLQDDSVVLKWEAGDSGRLEEVSNLVGSIDPSARPVQLEGFERHEVRSWCKNKVDWIRSQQQLQNDSSYQKALFQAADDVDFLLGQAHVPCVKLATLKVLTLQDAIDDLGDTKKPLRSFIKTLVANDGLEQLGRIVAVDMVAGNNDRFSPDLKEGNTVKLGNKSITLKTVVNVGNVMIATEGTRYQLSALDTFDPFSSWHRSGNSSLRESESYEKLWPGRYLVQKSLRKRYAENIITDLEALFTPARKGLFSALGRHAVNRLEWGMVEGGLAAVRAIKSYVKLHQGSLTKSRQEIIVELNKLSH